MSPPDIVFSELQAVEEVQQLIAGLIAAGFGLRRRRLNELICSASGPSGAREKTTWLSIMHFTLGSFPHSGTDEKSPDYVYQDLNKCLQNRAFRRTTRHSPEGYIMPEQVG